jgi:hypothetical protein
MGFYKPVFLQNRSQVDSPTVVHELAFTIWDENGWTGSDTTVDTMSGAAPPDQHLDPESLVNCLMWPALGEHVRKLTPKARFMVSHHPEQAGDSQMEPLLERCAGLDVHKKTVVTCRINGQIRVTGNLKSALLARPHRTCCSLPIGYRLPVAIESTGVYWQPVFTILKGQCGAAGGLTSSETQKRPENRGYPG